MSLPSDKPPSELAPHLHLRLVEAEPAHEIAPNSFQLVRITSPEQLDEAFRLRAKVYLEKKYITDDAIDELGREIDDFDDQSIHFGVYSMPAHLRDPKLVGYSRLVLKSEDKKLPVEVFYPELYVPKNSTEASRLMVDKDEIPGQLDLTLVHLALVRAMTTEAIRQDAPFIFAVLEEKLLARLRILGVQMGIESPKTYIPDYNSENYAARIEPQRVLPSIWSRDLKFRKIGEDRLTTQRYKYAPLFQDPITTGDYEGSISIESLSYNGQVTERNLGFLSTKEQEAISSATVAIAGCGGDGGAIAINLARNGVKHFKLADPEVFEPENINRQAGSNYATVNRNKAVAVAEEILRINPTASIDIFTAGVLPENVAEFIEGSDLVIDESEYTEPHIGVMIARKAREEGVNVLMAFNVGFGSFVTSFSPDGLTLERRLGIKEELSLDEIRDIGSIALSRWLGYIPSYVDTSVFKAVNSGEMSAPSVAQGVAFAAGLGSSEALLHIIHRYDPNSSGPNPTIAPRGLQVDAFDGAIEITNPRLRFYRSLAKAVLRTMIGKNPKAGKL